MSGGVVVIRDAVLFTGRAVDLVLYAVATAKAHRRRNGQPPLQALVDLETSLAEAARGHADKPNEDECQPDYMTTDEAAQMLGCANRTVRRKAPLLGGRIIGGRWFVDRQAVIQHMEGLAP